MPPDVATYRLQLNGDFGFEEARRVLDYLAALGVSHVYTSPCFEAVEGSTHFYDVVGPGRVADALGGADSRARFVEALEAAGMGQVIDIVPNHMAATEENPWWWDVLKRGRDSRYASYFDIDWEYSPKVELPYLTEALEEAIGEGLLRLGDLGGEAVFVYRDLRVPLREESEARAAGDDDPGRLGALLEEQHYRLVEWRRGPSYRRFFDTVTLVALKQETPEVFEDTHRLLLRWAGEDTTEVLRIDHVDGLRDPRAYLERLRERAPRTRLIVEKILEPGEGLRRDWPVEGTTGYGFIHLMNGLFLDPAGERSLTDTYETFTGETGSYRDIVYESKLQVLTEELASDVARLATRLRRLAGDGLSDGTAEAAVREAAACFPVYRTYVRADAGEVDEEDSRIIEEAFTAALERRPDLASALGPLREALLLRRGAEGADLAARFQQLTGPAAAKGIEDTAFYRYHRLVSLNEVGDDPGVFGIAVDDLHEHNLETLRRWPRTMLATTTHDTKRSEDVRARLAVLSEIPDAWREAVHRWAEINGDSKRAGVPDGPMEYLFYQTLVGAHPLSGDRARAYMEKAAREAKVHTSWRDPDPEYEVALTRFVENALGNDAFCEEVAAFSRRVEAPGIVNSLAQTLIKCTSPGIPDFYQGSELWDLRLVDPDNRRPVDYGVARRLLKRAASMSPADAWASRDEGAAKLLLILHALEMRRRHPGWFGPEGSYEPLAAEGPASPRVIAYRRGDSITVAPRLTLGLTRPWDPSVLTLPGGRWRDALSGSVWEGAADPAGLFSLFPVALLEKE